MDKVKSRRDALKLGIGAVGMVSLVKPVSNALAGECRVTPSQTSGPFYPGENRFDQENDLTRLPDHTERAKGQVVYVRGRVLDGACNPISDANVEVWQACASGKYNNSRDPNRAPLDPNFKYWAETFTDADGEYWFKTIIPGAYPADSNWTRPPHIHFRVNKLGFKDLVTQMYFKGDPLNADDLILQQIPANERDSVVVDFQPAPSDLEPGSLVGHFDITLRSIREPKRS